MVTFNNLFIVLLYFDVSSQLEYDLETLDYVDKLVGGSRRSGHSSRRNNVKYDSRLRHFADGITEDYIDRLINDIQRPKLAWYTTTTPCTEKDSSLVNSHDKRKAEVILYRSNVTDPPIIKKGLIETSPPSNTFVVLKGEPEIINSKLFFEILTKYERRPTVIFVKATNVTSIVQTFLRYAQTLQMKIETNKPLRMMQEVLWKYNFAKSVLIFYEAKPDNVIIKYLDYILPPMNCITTFIISKAQKWPETKFSVINVSEQSSEKFGTTIFQLIEVSSSCWEWKHTVKKAQHLDALETLIMQDLINEKVEQEQYKIGKKEKEHRDVENKSIKDIDIFIKKLRSYRLDDDVTYEEV